MSDTDSELLGRYTQHHAEDAFAELVRRYLGLVYSAALRQVRSPQFAEEVAQSAFIDLARSAAKLKPDTILTAWLYQVTRRTAIDLIRREASRQIREQVATEMNAINATAADWTQIEPLLDEAMHALNDVDRTAVLLRYFENKSLREVGAMLGMTDDAARKRVNRAVECLREFFAKHGVAAGGSGLALVISANAVQAAPAGLAFTVSTAFAGALSLTNATGTATATKMIAMTTLQKTLIAAVLTVAVGTGLYEARQASTLRHQVQAFQQRQVAPVVQTDQWTREREEAIRQLAGLREDNERLNRNTAELLKLRGEVARLRAVDSRKMEDSMESAAKALLGKMTFLKQRQEQMSHLKIPELQYLNDKTWANIANDHALETDDEIRQALCSLRVMAKQFFASRMGKALIAFVVANNGELPGDVLRLQPYFESPVDNALLQRYEMLQTGKLNDLPMTEPLVAEKAPVDETYESLFKIGVSGYSFEGIGLSHSGGHGTWATKDIERVKPFAKVP